MRSTGWLIALLVALPATSLAYSINLTGSGFIVRWDKVPVTYYVNPTGSGDISNGSDTAAIAAAFADWQAVGCSALTFTKLGNTTTAVVIANGAEPNGKNELTWVENNSWEFGQYVLGVTTPITYTTGTIIEADIAFNGYLSKWSTTGQFGRSDVKSVAIHEIGHMFGLQHNLAGFSQSNPPTMAPTADPYGKTASLEADDELGACFLYPAGGKMSCASDSQCPYVVDKNPETGQEFYTDKLVCNGSVCAFDSGGTATQKGLGELCESQNQCAGQLFCQPLQSGEAYCSQSCNPQTQDCPAGFGCFPYSDGQGGACIPVDEEKLALGEYCAGHDECESNLCYPSTNGSWQCRSPCNADTQCGGGQGCFVVPGYPSGACLPESLIPSYKVIDGDPCNEHLDCASEICVLNPGSGGPKFCRSGCNPSANTCSLGFICQPIGQGGACVPAPDQPPPPVLGGIGAACSADTECQSGLCQGGVCRQGCNLASPTCAAEQAEACQRLHADELAGYCVGRGTVEIGAVCSVDADCWSRFCEVAPGFATRVCLIGCAVGSEQCGEGQTCAIVEGLSTLGACFVETGANPTPDPTATGGTGAPTTGGGVDPGADSGGSRRASTTCAAAPSPDGGPTAALIFLGLVVAVSSLRRRETDRARAC